MNKKKQRAFLEFEYSVNVPSNIFVSQKPTDFKTKPYNMETHLKILSSLHFVNFQVF